MLRGSVGFAIVSIIGFSVWAFLAPWLHRVVGGFALFPACLLAFLGSAGLLLFPLVSGPNRFWRFYKLFIPAYCAYAAAWCVAWFAFRFGLGEWLGSFLGSIAFVAVVGLGLGNFSGFIKASAVLFICHSAGYFLGGEFMGSIVRISGPASLSKPALALVGKLGWGAIYGGGFGAGIGYVFHCFQSPAPPPRPRNLYDNN